MVRPAGSKLKVAVLAATGLVGQRYVSMLSEHPFFRVVVVTGQNSVGRKYGQAIASTSLPIADDAKRLTIRATNASSLDDVDVVFSPLPTDVAESLEPELVRAGFTVITDASPHRMDKVVPLIVPEVNPGHLGLLDMQRRVKGWKGMLVATPNCTAAGLAMVLKPLHDSLGLKRVIVSTLQAVSGAGYPGVPSLDIIDNVIPYVKDEEEKVEREPLKMLGEVGADRISPAKFEIGAMVHRVATTDGHLESLYVETEDRFDPQKVARVLSSFRGEPQKLKLPTAPAEPIMVTNVEGRPQPKLDRYAGTVPGMSVVVGRIRKGLDSKSGRLTLLSHNTIRGAAGSTILSAELMYRKGLLS
ncbi:MAG TPA: aspartate-semialdehyde dehydrogenase [Nitrososphaerales archaeon]|nr:aspartate-semialdehyde dehydrogenase [Nitrososphaerales archaeon]